MFAREPFRFATSLHVCLVALIAACGGQVNDAVPPSRSSAQSASPGVRAYDVGFNKFDLACAYLGSASGGDGSASYRQVDIAMARKALADARNAGATFLRTAITCWGPSWVGDQSDLALWQRDPNTYWSYMDQMMDDVEAAGMTIAPSFLWHDAQFPALAGSGTVRDLYTNPSSPPYLLASQYVTQFIQRYGSRPGLLFYEVGNEINLGADIDLVGYVQSQGGDTSLYGNYSTNDMIGFYARFTALIRSLDGVHPISSGFAMPRAEAYNTWQGHSGTDTLAELDAYLQATENSVDLMTVHAYAGSAGNDDYQRFGLGVSGMIGHLENVAESMGKKLYLGEVGDSNASDNQAAQGAFFQQFYAAVQANKVAYSSPWCFEFYQFALDSWDPMFNLEPGFSDVTLQAARGAAQAAGSYTPPSGADAVPPRVVLTVPRNGAVLASQAELFAVASDDRGPIARVEFYADSKLVSTATSFPYTAKVDTSAWPSGPHTILARAYDMAGNTTDSFSEVTGGIGASSGAPSIKLLTNGQSELNAAANTQLVSKWTVTNAVSVRSEIDIDGGADGCGNHDGEAWTASTSNGTTSTSFLPCGDGSTYYLTLIATSASGQEVRVVNTVHLSPPIHVLRSGSGCDDLECIWVLGTGFTSATAIVVRDSNWNPLATYSGQQLGGDLTTTPQSLTLRLASKQEQQLFGEPAGLIVTVFNGDDSWDSIGVTRN